jgi:hypothetical protein
LSSKKSAGYDFAGYDFGIFFENFCRLWFLAAKNKISQLKRFQSILITVYLCLRVLAIYLREFYESLIYLSSKKSAGYDFAGYDFAGYDFRPQK